MSIQRLYTFQSGKKASSAQMNAELDQLVGEVNNKETPEDAQIKVDTHANKTNNPHSVTTQQVNVLASNFKNATDSGDSYPIGLATFWTDTADWPTSAGLVFTNRLSSYRMHQFFYANQDSRVWSRTWYNGTWTAWDQLATVAGTQVWKLTQDNGRINLLSNTDLNTFFDAGTYYCGNTSLTNAPISQIGTLEVLKYNDNTVIQRYTTMVTTSGTQRVFIRYCDAGKWLSWQEIAMLDWVKGYGLGVAPATITDANSLSTSGDTGFYNCSGTTSNIPTLATSGGALIHLGKSSRPCQIFQDYQTNTTYTRTYTASGWTAWQALAVDDSTTRLSIWVHRDVNYSIAANTLTKMSFNLGPYGRKTEQWANNRFTVPKTGVYAFDISVTFDSLSQYSVGELYLYKNGAKWKRIDKVIAPGSTNLTAQGSLTNYAVANDYYEFFVFASEATSLNMDTFATISQITP